MAKARTNNDPKDRRRIKRPRRQPEARATGISYDLHGLDPRTFQHLVQALAICELGPGVIVYGDGPDGGRDASFNGKLSYSTNGKTWDGYTIVQAKFRQKSGDDPQAEGAWLKGQIDAEMAKFSGVGPRCKRPEFYLIVTSVELTPVPPISGVKTAQRSDFRSVLTG